MVPFVTSLWMAAALAQGPPSGTTSASAPEAAWLKSVPAEAEVVIRVRAPQAIRDDMAKMFEAMSPTLAQQATPALDMGLAQFAQRFGKAAQNQPFLVVARLPKPGDAGPPPYAVLVKAKDYAAVQKQVVGPGGNATPKPQPGGFDELAGADNQPIYTFKGADFVAFGSSKDLIAGIAKPRATIDRALTPDLRERFLGGDLGAYVNLAAVQDRYGEEIGQARKGLLDQLDKAGQANKGAGQSMQAAKEMYGRLFDALKNGNALAMHFDFDPKGLTVSGLAAVKSGSDAAKALASARTGSAEGLGRLPSDAAFYTYSNVNPTSFERYQKMATSFLSGGGKPPEEFERAMKAQRDAGPREIVGAVTMGGKGGMRSISLITFDDPQKAAEAANAGAAAMKADRSALPEFIKDVEVTPDAEKYKGFTFSRTRVTFDPEKLAQLAPSAPNAPKPPGGGGLTAMFGGDSVTTWTGTDGKTFLTVTAPDWNQAKALIDGVLASGKGGLGQVAGYQSLRATLPKQVGSLFLVSAQGLIRQGMAQFAALQPDSPAAKADLNLPKAPAFFGGAVTPNPKGYQFQFVVPSPVGAVVEQAILPLMQGNKAQE